MTQKLRAAIIGPGNIGTDLLMKALRSDWIEPVWMVGIDDSPGIQRAREMGLKVSTDGVDGLLPHIEEDRIQFAFDATSAYVHAENSRKLTSKGVIMIDLTPAAIGPYCIPPVNLQTLLAEGVKDNVNMVTCGGQATIPLVAAVSRVQHVGYAEIVATVASASVGMGTRDNIDEFTRTTAAAIEQVGGARQGKAIIIINPAEPPLIMRDTVHCLTVDEPDRDAICASFRDMIAEVQKYVPGYQMLNEPMFDGKRVTISVQVEGLGDFLPKYSGNLDIMTAAALRTAEMMAQQQAAK
ncbi:MAG: acetaldehyde dehydrogenase (acetylating) [Gammaproteobacteria bacterium]|uniref:acetaldehyde dehydrogenase (acetylating) n=1 Tax=Pseudomaricurvus alcaniphilus TaxID=1166482 RepID=UPI00140C5306|nr:acetaldehyde dehydrogenase (acetylating) [Pseudomaricurvus alcaniphilus]MBR9912978.1 acetaldehyde dehydrogenase (acetylating) [Gammaproteobacteria bacterium]NHN36460.1 acetaldehyde dehydrogenase (acetylating) [Pseudomaricurvus alcaniphilus]